MVRLSSKISGLSHLDIKKPLPQCSDIHSDIKCDPYNNASNAHTLIKKFLIYKKFRREQWQSYIWLKASSYMTKYLRIFSYIRKPFLIHDFATAPFWISLYMRNFFFLSVYFAVDPCTVLRESNEGGSHFYAIVLWLGSKPSPWVANTGKTHREKEDKERGKWGRHYGVLANVIEFWVNSNLSDKVWFSLLLTPCAVWWVRLGCPSKLVSIRNNRNWNRN
jgi:hypothetical protein